MPIANIQDTTGVEQKLQEILSNGDVDRRLQAIRELFVGILDYDNADQLVSLESAGNAQLPKDAHVAARRDGVTVAYIPLDDAPTNLVNGIVASAAAKALGNVLVDDLLLVFTNRDRDQLHIISPDLSGSRPKLQRLVAYRDQLQRTVPQQIAKMWDNYGNKGMTLRKPSPRHLASSQSPGNSSRPTAGSLKPPKSKSLGSPPLRKNKSTCSPKHCSTG